jgi:hypothetical protein
MFRRKIKQTTFILSYGRWESNHVLETEVLEPSVNFKTAKQDDTWRPLNTYKTLMAYFKQVSVSEEKVQNESRCKANAEDITAKLMESMHMNHESETGSPWYNQHTSEYPDCTEHTRIYNMPKHIDRAFRVGDETIQVRINPVFFVKSDTHYSCVSGKTRELTPFIGAQVDVLCKGKIPGYLLNLINEAAYPHEKTEHIVEFPYFLAPARDQRVMCYQLAR